MINIAMENHHLPYLWQIHYKSQFSTEMLNYQRVRPATSESQKHIGGPSIFIVLPFEHWNMVKHRDTKRFDTFLPLDANGNVIVFLPGNCFNSMTQKSFATVLCTIPWHGHPAIAHHSELPCGWNPPVFSRTFPSQGNHWRSILILVPLALTKMVSPQLPMAPCCVPPKRVALETGWPARRASWGATRSSKHIAATCRAWSRHRWLCGLMLLGGKKQYQTQRRSCMVYNVT